MKLIVFIHQDSHTTGKTLNKIITSRFKGIEIQTVQTFNSLKAILKQLHNYDNEIFVLLADSKSRLKKLMFLIDLMEDKRILLILPDDSKAVTSIAHQFFPRYFTYINDTYTDLCAVITKMTNKKIMKIKEGSKHD